MKTDFEAQLKFLKELQEVDLRLEEITSTLDGIAERIIPFKTEYNSLKEELTAAKGLLAEAEKARRHEELELASSTERAKERETKLYALKTTKEYQAALKEIAEVKKAKKDREDRILSLMEQIETLTQKITQLEKDSADKEAAYRKESETLLVEEEGLKKQRQECESRRPALVSQIEKTIIRKYDYVHERYADVLVNVDGGVCQGCSMNIPPQLYNEMLKFSELKNCPSCHRLIYVIKEESKI